MEKFHTTGLSEGEKVNLDNKRHRITSADRTRGEKMRSVQGDTEYALISSCENLNPLYTRQQVKVRDMFVDQRHRVTYMHAPPPPTKVILQIVHRVLARPSWPTI